MDDKANTLTAHLSELRRRVLYCAVVLVAGIIVSFLFRDFIFDLLKRPADDPKLYFHQITGFIGPTMKVAMLGGFILALPVLVYNAVMFLAPGLTLRERRYLYLMLPAVAAFFLAGVAFAYFLLVPPIVEFLFEFGEGVAEPLVSIGSYMNTVVGLLFWMGVGFETPLLMYFLAAIGIATPRFYARQRRIWIVVSFVLAAVITPTFDPVNQSIVAGPFIVLYELGILFARVAVRGEKAKQCV
ncbi:twin-arginine translocase subunit TatC [Dehalococcoidia bacterium]|nr:twin-arginine translocase subunit TatC [Dehalococcoidia bacterium]